MLLKWQEENLRKFRPNLVDNIDVENSKLLNCMLAKNIITLRQVASIQLPLNDPFKKVEMLLDNLNRRPPKDYDIFLKCLEESEQSHIAEMYLIEGAKGDCNLEEEQGREPESGYCVPHEDQTYAEACRYSAPKQPSYESKNAPGEQTAPCKDEYLHTMAEPVARLAEGFEAVNIQEEGHEDDEEGFYDEIADPPSPSYACAEQEVDEDALKKDLLQAVKEGIKSPIRVLPAVISSYEVLIKQRGKELYQMRGIHKGKCIIISVRHVKGSVERQGTEQDKNLLEKLFTSIGYKVSSYTDADDLTAKGIMEKMKSFSDNLSDEDLSTVVCLLSHGSDGVVYGTDGLTVTLTSILSLLNNQHCPKMQNKPKMIFTQACRGDEIDYGVAMPDNKPEKPCDSMYDQHELSRHPKFTDFLIGSATQKDTKAWRDLGGSYYIKALVIVFMKFAHIWSVPDMLTKVNNLVSKTTIRSSDVDEVCQMPTFELQLRKDLYFFPGI